MITAEIAGYTFDTEQWCPECMAAWADRQAIYPASAGSLEDRLTYLAALWDVDRDYADSNDFPVPFSGQQAQTDASWADHEHTDLPRCCVCKADFAGEF